MNQRLAIFSAHYYPGRGTDAYRRALLDQFTQIGLDVLFVHATDFFDETTGVPRSDTSERDLLHGLSNFVPDAVLFLNPGGRVPSIQNLIAERGIWSATWCWDHPGIFSPHLIAPSRGHFFTSANLTFSAWLTAKRYSTNPVFIPFPFLREHPPEGAFDEAKWIRREIRLLFMGTIWNTFSYSQMLNWANSTTGHTLHLDQLVQEIDQHIALCNTGMLNGSQSGSAVLQAFRTQFRSPEHFMQQTNNFLSSQERLSALRIAASEGLHLHGSRDEWEMYIELFLPELKRVYRPEYVSEMDRMLEICRNTKIGLNIFHRQNQDGGTNFRFMEYAMAGTPILSNRNTECERLFPHGEAALYYTRPEEIPALCKQLEANPIRAVGMARAAWEIAHREFQIARISISLMESLGVSTVRQARAGSLYAFDKYGIRDFETQPLQAPDTVELGSKAKNDGTPESKRAIDLKAQRDTYGALTARYIRSYGLPSLIIHASAQAFKLVGAILAKLSARSGMEGSTIVLGGVASAIIARLDGAIRNYRNSALEHAGFIRRGLSWAKSSFGRAARHYKSHGLVSLVIYVLARLLTKFGALLDKCDRFLRRVNAARNVRRRRVLYARSQD